jgi:acyl-CoA reductase-like NAD-dependent aldehyde dehydrogenase
METSGLVVVVLASNLPGLAVQPLLQALALRRPTLLKSPSAEPLFAPAFVAALTRREPALADAVAALTWPGGDEQLEAPLLAAADEVVAYGEAETLADLARRAPGKVRGHGPRASLAVVGPGAWIDEVARGLARDVALFDQRGCLSVQAIYATPEVALSLAPALARALGEIAVELPPGPLDPALAARVQQARAEAEMRGLEVHALPLRQGTVVVEREGTFQPTPGLRTVRVHPLADLERLPALLAPWSGRLQGVAVAGAVPDGLEAALAGLGASRFAPPGELQDADANWENPAVALVSD